MLPADSGVSYDSMQRPSKFVNLLREKSVKVPSLVIK